MRALALTLALLALPALAADGAARAAAAGAGESENVPHTDVRDPDFEPDVPMPSIAIGALESGRAMFSADVGWLRSGVKLDISVARFFGFFFSLDSMLLYRGVSGETGIHGGLRFTPFSEGPFRLSIEGSAGQIFIPAGLRIERVTQLRGDVIGGVTVDRFTAYARAGMIGLSGTDVPRSSAFNRQEEVGAGVEVALRRRYVLGAEASGWSRERRAGFPQWRLRAGLVL